MNSSFCVLTDLAFWYILDKTFKLLCSYWQGLECDLKIFDLEVMALTQWLKMVLVWEHDVSQADVVFSVKPKFTNVTLTIWIYYGWQDKPTSHVAKGN